MSFRNNYRSFCRFVAKMSIRNLKKLLKYHRIPFQPTDSHEQLYQKLCQVYYKWNKYPDSLLLEDCNNLEDPLDNESLMKTPVFNILKTPTNNNKFNCYKKNRLKQWLQTKNCQINGDHMSGDCLDYYSQPILLDDLRDVLSLNTTDNEKQIKYFVKNRKLARNLLREWQKRPSRATALDGDNISQNSSDPSLYLPPIQVPTGFRFGDSDASSETDDEMVLTNAELRRLERQRQAEEYRLATIDMFDNYDDY